MKQTQNIWKNLILLDTPWATAPLRIPKVSTSCKCLPIDTNFVSILLFFSVLFSWTPYLLLISSANEPANGLILIHTVKLKPIIKAQILGKLVTSGISDVATASVHSEKTRLKRLIMIIIIITSKWRKKYVGMA